MKRSFLATMVLLFVISANAQMNDGPDYKTALGVKVYPGAVSVKHFFKDKIAVEGLGYVTSDGFRVTGLYELYNNLGNVEGLKWYIGPGAHVGFYDYYDHHNNHIDGTFFGIDGVLGLDYKFKGAPINVSIDWQPSFEFGDYVGFDHYGGIGIRYTF